MVWGQAHSIDHSCYSVHYSINVGTYSINIEIKQTSSIIFNNETSNKKLNNITSKHKLWLTDYISTLSQMGRGSGKNIQVTYSQPHIASKEIMITKHATNRHAEDERLKLRSCYCKKRVEPLCAYSKVFVYHLIQLGIISKVSGHDPQVSGARLIHRINRMIKVA